MEIKRMLILLFVLFFTGIPAFGGRLITIQTPVMGDLNGADWHPSGAYALVVGEGIYKCYDGGSGYVLEALPNIPPVVCTAVDWRPQGDIAFVTSQDGYMYTCDGNDVVELSLSVTYPLTDAAYSPSGDIALIVGYGGTLLAYENGTFTDYSLPPTFTLNGVTWHPSGDYALIAGTESFYDEKVFRWEKGTVTEEWSGPGGLPGGIDFHPSGAYAVIVESWGHVAKYDSLSGYQPLDTPFVQETNGLTSITWSAAGDTALITGAWSYVPFPDQRTCIEFNGDQFNVLRMDDTIPEPFQDAAWKPDGTAALVVGEFGGLMLYDPELKVMGDIRCDEKTYHTGEVLNLLIDLMNFGPSTTVDIYITLNLDGMSLYWPTFSLQPIALQAVLKKGFLADDYVLWQCVVPKLNKKTWFNWDMRIYQAGFTDDDHLLSYSTMEFSIAP